MVDLLWLLLQMFGSALPIRLAYVISGMFAIGCGLLIFAGRLGGPFLVAAVFLVAGGVALIVVGITLRVPQVGASVRKTPPPDDWRPPDGEEVKKIIEGR